MQHTRRGLESVGNDGTRRVLRADLIAPDASDDALLPAFRRVDLVLVDEPERVFQPLRILEAQRQGLVSLVSLGRGETSGVLAELQHGHRDGRRPQTVSYTHLRAHET